MRLSRVANPMIVVCASSAHETKEALMRAACYTPLQLLRPFPLGLMMCVHREAGYSTDHLFEIGRPKSTRWLVGRFLLQLSDGRDCLLVLHGHRAVTHHLSGVTIPLGDGRRGAYATALPAWKAVVDSMSTSVYQYLLNCRWNPRC